MDMPHLQLGAVRDICGPYWIQLLHGRQPIDTLSDKWGSHLGDHNLVLEGRLAEHDCTSDHADTDRRMLADPAVWHGREGTHFHNWQLLDHLLRSAFYAHDQVGCIGTICLLRFSSLPLLGQRYRFRHKNEWCDGRSGSKHLLALADVLPFVLAPEDEAEPLHFQDERSYGADRDEEHTQDDTVSSLLHRWNLRRDLALKWCLGQLAWSRYQGRALLPHLRG